jgi:CRP/FNR family cyclic AMP-dependent transcriptional regulator
MAKIKPKARLLQGDEFFEAAGVVREVVEFAPSATIFVQGQPGDSVMFVRKGTVKLTVLSKTGKEAVVGLLGDGDFFGEGCLAGQTRRMATATAMTPSAIVVVDKREMASRLHANPAFSDRFLSHMLRINSTLLSVVLHE